MGLIGDHLRGLLRFAGREPRQPFWLWVLAVMVATTIGTAVTFVPLFLDTFGKIEQFAREHPDQVTRTVGPNGYSIEVHGYHPELMPDFTWFIGGMLAISILVVFLLAAAVARRLHDSGRSGWWGIMPLPFLLCSFGGMYRMFSWIPTGPTPAVAPNFLALFAVIFICNMVYLGTLIALIVLCSMASWPGDNRYGAGFGAKR